MTKLTPEELERFIHRHLHGLPDRPAPRTLEVGVVTAIKRQALLPWYRQSWHRWPQAARVIFLILATAATGGVVVGFYLGFTSANVGELAAEIRGCLGVFARIWHGIDWVLGLGRRLIAGIPTAWLFGGGMVIVLLHATLLGLGAAAYRTLYRNH